MDPERVLSLAREHLGRGQLLFVGVIDPIHPKVETPEQVRDGVLLAGKYIPVEPLGTTDDCGFAPSAASSTSREVAFAKIRARVAGTELAGRELFEQ